MQHDWKTKHEQRYAAGLSVIPPDAKQAIFATQIGSDGDGAAMGIERDAAQCRGRYGEPGRDERRKAWDDRNDKIVGLPAGCVCRSIRSDLGRRDGARPIGKRWAAGFANPIRRAKPNLSPYLTEAFGYANNLGTPIILAIDLAGYPFSRRGAGGTAKSRANSPASRRPNSNDWQKRWPESAA